MNDWISVRDRLPTTSRLVFAHHREYGFVTGSYPHGKSSVWHIQPYKGSWKIPFPDSITHWLPIPDLPKALPQCPHCGHRLDMSDKYLRHMIGITITCPYCEDEFLVDVALYKKER